MYTWHDKHYLGAAHGLAGILTLLLQVGASVIADQRQHNVRRTLLPLLSPPCTTQLPLPSLRPRVESLVRPTVDYLLTLQLPSGNFPSSLESAGSDRLVHWCHGAPGFTHLMAHAYRVRRAPAIVTYTVYSRYPCMLQCDCVVLAGIWGPAIPPGCCRLWGGSLGAWSATQRVWPLPWRLWQCLFLPAALPAHRQTGVP